MTIYRDSLPAHESKGKFRCLNRDSKCDKQCLYISGGTGFGKDPQTGEMVVVGS